MGFQWYSDENIPRRGTAKKIYDVLKSHGFCVECLMYNSNNWGRDPAQGYGTWGVAMTKDGEKWESWCGWDDEKGAYLQKSRLPFGVVWLGKLTLDK